MKWADLLVNPNTKEKLDIDHKNGKILHVDEDFFTNDFVNNIPMILPKKVKASTESSVLHQSFQSEFDYVDHYHKDAEYFDYFQQYDELSEVERNRLNQLIINAIQKDDALILDVGAGNGWLSKQVQKDSNQVVSLDISIENVSRVLKEQPHPNHLGIVADVFHLPFANNTFDYIVASEIIEHVFDPRLFIEKLTRILKPGGQLIITTPNNEKIPTYLCIHCNKPTPRDGHLHSFTTSSFQKLLPRSLSKARIFTSSSKIFIKSRIQYILKALPFSFWNIIDQAGIKAFGKPARLIAILTK